MDSKTFDEVTKEQIERCTQVLFTKAKEYATHDRLHNFRVASELTGTTDRQALAGMMAKHTVSVYDMCMDPNPYPIALWEEKITDSINYLLLLNALVRDHGGD